MCWASKLRHLTPKIGNLNLFNPSNLVRTNPSRLLKPKSFKLRAKEEERGVSFPMNN